MKSYKTKNMNLQLFTGDTITDLTGYTWTPNATIEFPSVVTYSINYNIVCANTEYNATGGTSLDFNIKTFTHRTKEILFCDLNIDTPDCGMFSGAVYSDGIIFEGSNGTTMSDTRSYSPSYVTEIQFTGGDDAINPTLISWLQVNGTLTAPQPTGYSSTINLTNCTCNKSSESGLSGSYSATITANDGYYLSSVTSTLGTATIAENKKTATVTISDVNADFTISATGNEVEDINIVLHPNNNGVTDYTKNMLPKVKSATTLDIQRLFRTEYTITNSITNGTASGDTNIWTEETASVTITPNTDYTLPSSITVTGASYIYDSTTGIVSLSNATGNVTISATCESSGYSGNITAFTVSEDLRHSGGTEI